jgi:hypothetical protein
MPDYFQLMSGTFLEIGPVHVLASGSVDHLRRLHGRHRPDRQAALAHEHLHRHAQRAGAVGRGRLDRRNCARGPGRGLRRRRADRVVRHINARAGGAAPRPQRPAHDRPAPPRLPRCLLCIRPAPFAAATRSHSSVDDGAEVGPATAGGSFLVPNLVPDAPDLTLAGRAEPRRTWLYPGESERQGANA